MSTPSRYAVTMAALESVRDPVEQQVEEQSVSVHHDYVSADELDRARLLSPTGAGKLRVR